MDETTEMTLGEKLRAARKRAGLTQEQLSNKLLVSRQAVTKWESDRVLPDEENLKQLSRLLGVSVDYLLQEDGMEVPVLREPIDLKDYPYDRTLSGRWVKKAGQKDRVVRGKYPDAEIHYLLGKQILTKSERTVDNLLGFLTDAPFGIPDILNGLKNTDKEFYLVIQGEQQFLVTVTDEFVESRQLAKRVTGKKFETDGFSFTVCSLVPEPEGK